MKRFGKVMLRVVRFIGKLGHYIFPYRFQRYFQKLADEVFTSWILPDFKQVGVNICIRRGFFLQGGKYITLGSNVIIGKRVVLTAWDKTGDEIYFPRIIIGNNSSIGDDSHITAINSIEIGDNVLTGKKITITDNAHGESNSEMLALVPKSRPLYSKGPVVIEDGVWIGEKVTILPGVRIGENSIIGANAVVTKDIPRNSVASGIPAKVVKKII